MYVDCTKIRTRTFRRSKKPGIQTVSDDCTGNLYLHWYLGTRRRLAGDTPAAACSRRSAPVKRSSPADSRVPVPPPMSAPVTLDELEPAVRKAVAEQPVVDLHTHLPVSYTHLRAHETLRYLVCRLLLEKKK